MRRSLVVVLALALSPFVARVASAQSDTSSSTTKCFSKDRGGNPSPQGDSSRSKHDCIPTPPPPPPPPPTTGVTSVTGFLFFDLNQNGVFDQDEVGISGFNVQISGNGITPQTAMTDGNGSYTFTGLSAGSYTICALPPAGWNQTGPASGASCANGTIGITITAPSQATDTSLTGINLGFISA